MLKPTLQTTTQNGVTCTNNGDGTYTLKGTASASAEFTLYGTNNLLELNKEFRLTGCPNNTSTYLVIGDWGDPWKVFGKDHGNGSNFKITTSSPAKRVVIAVPEGATVDNIVFKPMITNNLNATYDDFVPYTGDTGSLNGDVADLKGDVDGLKNETKVTINDASTTSATETWSAKKINEKTARNFDNRIILSVGRGTSGEYTDTTNLNNADGAYLYWSSTAGQEKYSVGVILYVNNGWIIIPIKETDGGTDITFSIAGSILTMTKSSSTFPSAGGVIALGTSI